MRDRTLAAEIAAWVEELGYEVVGMEDGGTARRPLLRLRIDRLHADAESGVTVEDCTRVSRHVEARLDERPGLSATYVLEVSSPGVERPLVRARDFRRFVGKEAVVQGRQPLAGEARKLQGEILGIEGEAGEERVRLRTEQGEEVEVPYARITKANLVFRWGGEGRAPKRSSGENPSH
jgi:ribosome maturation factor RimP